MNCYLPSIVMLATVVMASSALPETNAPSLIELQVMNIVIGPDGRSPVIVAVENKKKRFLPIWVGVNEAQAIMMELRQIKPPRPMTHDLIGSLIRELGGKVDRLVITEMRDNTYVGVLALTVNGKQKEVDCRPSDGIAIALRVKAPIYAVADVMQHAMPMPEAVVADETRSEEIASLVITIQTITPDLAEAFGINETRGVLVSATKNPELKVGDIIIGVGDTDVNSITGFRAVLDKTGVDDPVVLRILRQGQPTKITVLPRPPQQ